LREYSYLVPGAIAVTLDSCKIPLTEDTSGVIRVENTRVTLDSVVLAYREGASAEEISERFPAITLGAVYAAITFYLQNRTEIDTYLKRREAEAEQIRTQSESRPEAKEFRERLLARRAAKESS
jgi:uncharacterized protein (DUF433 family)